MKELGYDLLIAGTQRTAITRVQITSALEAGFTQIQAYVYLYWSLPVASQVRQAFTTLTGLPVTMLWLDCEDPYHDKTSQEMTALIAEGVAAAGDRPVGIYTRASWWRPSTGDSQGFCTLPLWDARYTSQPDLNAFEPYGGWTKREMQQHAGDTTLEGISVDLNLYRKR